LKIELPVAAVDPDIIHVWLELIAALRH
jgi:hypothetical protein